MSKQVWLITGAGRGMGADFAKAALAAGHSVVATGRRPRARRRRPRRVERSAGREARRHEPRRRRGRGSGRSRSVRPHRRAGQQRRELLRGLLRGIDAGADRPAAGDQPHRPDERHARRSAGDAQAALGTHHLDLFVRRSCRRLRLRAPPTPRRSSASRAGWSRCRPEVAPFGIHTTIVNPGFFRTELLTEQSTNYAAPSIARLRRAPRPLVEYWKSQNGQQSGDPAKLARALITIAGQSPPPRRFIAGADAIATAEQKIADLKAQIEANRELSTSLAFGN